MVDQTEPGASCANSRSEQAGARRPRVHCGLVGSATPVTTATDVTGGRRGASDDGRTDFTGGNEEMSDHGIA
jgi:hypothetical protein